MKAWRRGEERKELWGGGVSGTMGGGRFFWGGRIGKEEEGGSYFIPRELPQWSQ